MKGRIEVDEGSGQKREMYEKWINTCFRRYQFRMNYASTEQGVTTDEGAGKNALQGIFANIFHWAENGGEITHGYDQSYCNGDTDVVWKSLQLLDPEVVVGKKKSLHLCSTSN